jgi:hypothetical protein
MTVTAWTEEHGIGVKSYYYWQRKVRRAMAQLMQPQLPSVVPEKQVAFAEIECQPSQTPPETLEIFKPDAVLRRCDQGSRQRRSGKHTEIDSEPGTGKNRPNIPDGRETERSGSETETTEED